MSNDSRYYRDIIRQAEEAARNLVGVAYRTPLLENAEANHRLGGRFFIKAENLQRTGAFKIRGAYNTMRHLNKEELARGAITYSSGNHALGVALAARELGSSALIVMPDDAPEDKRQAVRDLGAEIVFYDRNRETSDDVVARVQKDTGRIVVPPSGNDRVLAGAATTALELKQQADAAGAVLGSIVIPCGGGGLTSATALVFHELSPQTKVYAAEPKLFDDTRRSLLAGERVENPTGITTICDSIMTKTPNAQTFEINRKLLKGAVTASDGEVREAMRFVYEYYRVVVEPGACVGIAAILNGQIRLNGGAAATVATGGNIDSARFCTLLNEGQD